MSNTEKDGGMPSVEITDIQLSQLDLPKLARAYANGQLEFEEYRLARRQLIDKLTADNTIMVRKLDQNEDVASRSDNYCLTVTTPRNFSICVISVLLLTLFVVIILVFWIVVI